MSAGRKVCSAIVWVWVCIVSQLKRLAGRSPKNQQPLPVSKASVGNVGTSPATGQEMEWEESWNTMEPFSVTVVPTDGDLFQDMQPVLTKTKKVYIGGAGAEERLTDKQKFAVETEFRGLDSGELGEWKDEEMGEGGGWEGETGKEEGALVVASREAMAQQRKEEREKRRKLHEALRFNQCRQQQGLGVRLSDS